MINLLSQENKDAIKREYSMRVLTIVTLFLLALTILGTAFLIPSYLAVSTSEKIEREELDQLKAKRDPEFDALYGVVRATNAKLALFSEGEKKESLPLDILSPVLSTRGGTIMIDEIAYSGGDKKELALRGMAVSRDALLSYTQALESTGLYEKIDIPLSVLLKDINIEFNLSVKKKNPNSVQP